MDPKQLHVVAQLAVKYSDSLATSKHDLTKEELLRTPGLTPAQRKRLKQALADVEICRTAFVPATTARA